MHPIVQWTISFITVCFCILIIRISYLMASKYKNKFVYNPRSNFVKTLVVLGSGGHTAEMLRIVQRLDKSHYSPRLYVYACTDVISADKVKEIEVNNQDYSLVAIKRSREVSQSYITSIWTTILATFNCIPLLWYEKPDIILCNGPGTCIPICIISFFLHVLNFQKTIIIFIESICRVKTFSLSGKILYSIADSIIVQWPYLSKPLYKRSILISH